MPISALLKEGDKVKILYTVGGLIATGEVRSIRPIKYGPIDQDGNRVVYALNDEYHAKFCKIVSPYHRINSGLASTATGKGYVIWDAFHKKCCKVCCDSDCIFPADTADEDCMRLGKPLIQQLKYIPGQTVLYSPGHDDPKDQAFYGDQDYAEVMAVDGREVWILHAFRFDPRTRTNLVSVVVDGRGLRE